MKAPVATEPGAGEAERPATKSRVVLVTGMSGAGKSSALKALEDIGYEAVDNLPLALLGGLVQTEGELPRPLAIGVDIRTRDFGVDSFVERLGALRANPQIEVRLLFVDCDDEVLRRRFTATRRRHPVALDRPVTHGIARERALISPLRTFADVTVDTSSLTLGALRATLSDHFALDAESALSVVITSFSYSLGLPREADLVFDVRFLANPHYEPALSPLTGKDPAVASFIERDVAFPRFFNDLCRMIEPLLPRFDLEGKSYLTIAIGCTGGRHRSVFVAEKLAAWLGSKGQRVSVHHRDVDRTAAQP